jgi:hypothetical protein
VVRGVRGGVVDGGLGSLYYSYCGGGAGELGLFPPENHVNWREHWNGLYGHGQLHTMY